MKRNIFDEPFALSFSLFYATIFLLWVHFSGSSVIPDWLHRVADVGLIILTALWTIGFAWVFISFLIDLFKKS